MAGALAKASASQLYFGPDFYVGVCAAEVGIGAAPFSWFGAPAGVGDQL